MAAMPFEILDHRRVEGGLSLILRCAECGAEILLIVRDGDPLTGKFPVACACGVRANLFFGAPSAGRALLRSLGGGGPPWLAGPVLN